MGNSIWKKNIRQLENDKIDEKNIDVLIIGGGLSGISTAFELRNSNLNICLIESNNIGSGATSLTTGKVTYLQNTIYTDLEKVHNFDISKKYLESQLYASKILKDNIKKYNINCDYIQNDSYIFSYKQEDKYKIDGEYNILKKMNIKSQIVNKLPIQFPCNYALKVSDTAVFNPVKYINSLIDIIKNKVKIYEHVRALKLTKENGYYIVNTTSGNIKAKYVVVSTQYPFFVIPGLIPFKTHIEKSHVVASKIPKTKTFNAISIGKQTYSIRYYNDKEPYIIFAGESYKMSNHIDYEQRQKELEIKFKELFNLNPEYRWSIHDITSNDLLPIIGEVSDNLIVSTAFNKWGMTNSILSGKIISDIILKNDNKYISLFNPKRKITIKRTINFVVDTFSAGKIFLLTKLNKNKSFYNDKVKFVNIGGKSYGIYIDNKKNKHIVRNLCPHMKCSLVFNFMDKTWDCPCHGSRYDIDGNVIKGPSSFDIKVDNKNNIN
ncbi:MAG: FAD-dependent oxidoreductase [Bacilli bacterium]|nr:FAD-dependent oxidoreductase [Bacilli bacterium]